MKVRIIITGGTFDKCYDELKGKLTFKKTHLPDVLKQVRVTVPVKMEINQLIDSLHMNDEKRAKLLDACKKAKEKHILVTHGTDTMVETARFLGRARLKKTVVLTGAMVPYTVHNSDSVFNLGCALIGAQVLKPGVYVAMNGQVFRWNNVMKNYQKGVFETAANVRGRRKDRIKPATKGNRPRHGH